MLQAAPLSLEGCPDTSGFVLLLVLSFLVLGPHVRLCFGLTEVKHSQL